METYKVHVLTPGHMLVLHGKRSRTPVVYTKLLKSEVDMIESQARRSMLKFTVVNEADIKKVPDILIEEIEFKEDEDIEIEEMEEEEPSTILEKLIAKEK